MPHTEQAQHAAAAADSDYVGISCCTELRQCAMQCATGPTAAVPCCALLFQALLCAAVCCCCVAVSLLCPAVVLLFRCCPLLHIQPPCDSMCWDLARLPGSIAAACTQVQAVQPDPARGRVQPWQTVAHSWCLGGANPGYPHIAADGQSSGALTAAAHTSSSRLPHRYQRSCNMLRWQTPLLCCCGSVQPLHRGGACSWCCIFTASCT